MKPQSAGGRNRRKKNRGKTPPLSQTAVFQTALAAGSPERGNRGCAAASRNKIEERPRRRQGEIRKALPAAKRTVQGARILPPRRRWLPVLQEAERREKSAGHRRGKKSGAGAKALPLEQNSSPLGDGSPCKGHAVTATDRESTPGSWQKTGRSKPDAFYARPPALGAGV